VIYPDRRLRRVRRAQAARLRPADLGTGQARRQSRGRQHNPPEHQGPRPRSRIMNLPTVCAGDAGGPAPCRLAGWRRL